MRLDPRAMTDTDSQTSERGDADTSAEELPAQALQRHPSYVKAATELQGEAAMILRCSSEDLNIPREPLAERLPPNWLRGDLRVSPSLYAVARTKFTFTNSHWTPLYVAFIGWDESCENDCGFGEYTTGWFELAPAETQTFSNPSQARKVFYYAEGTDGSVYNGRSLGALVMDVQFRVCGCHQSDIPTGESSPWYPVDFDELDFGQWSGVVFF